MTAPYHAGPDPVALHRPGSDMLAGIDALVAFMQEFERVNG